MMTHLLCVPPAGGTAAAFRSWEQWLSESFAAEPLELPGHGTRSAGQPSAEIGVMARELLPAARRAADSGPVALLGHSMGALVAFEMAHLLHAEGISLRHVFVLTSLPPERAGAGTDESLSSLDDDALLDALREYPALPESVRADRELLAMGLAVIRADLRACETYQPPRDRAPLDCPLTVVTGRYDPTVSAADAVGWEAHTRAGFRHVEVPASHDVVSEAGTFLRRFIQKALAG